MPYPSTVLEVANQFGLELPGRTEVPTVRCRMWRSIFRTRGLPDHFWRELFDLFNDPDVTRRSDLMRLDDGGYAGPIGGPIGRRMIPRYQDLSESFILDHRHSLDWSTVSLRHLLTPAVLSECSGLIDCEHLCLNKFRNDPSGPLYLEFLEQHRSSIRWEKFGRVIAIRSLHEPFSRQLLESVADAAAWRELSSDEGVPEEVYQRFPGRIDWEAVSRQPREFSPEFLDRFTDCLNWDSIVERRLQSHQRRRRSKVCADDFLDSVPKRWRESGKRIWAERIGGRLDRRGCDSVLHQNVREEAFWVRCDPSPDTDLPAESPKNLIEWLDLPTLFYPGSGIDVSPALLFANWGMVRTIIHADYWLNDESMEAACARFEQFGWRRESEGHVTPEDLGGEHWMQFFRDWGGPGYSIREDPGSHFRTRASQYRMNTEFGFYKGEEVPARSRWTLFKPAFEAGLPNRANASGVMFLQLSVEAIYTCWNLWGPTSRGESGKTGSGLVRRPPVVVVLQDYVLGGQWASFGGSSLLSSIFEDTGYPPDFIFVDDWTTPWKDYCRASPSFHCHLSGGDRHRSLHHAPHIGRALPPAVSRTPPQPN